jgi:hypothetical protein
MKTPHATPRRNSMRKLVALVAVVTGALALTGSPATAITGNFVEDTEHPFVGLVVFYDDDGEFLHRCSGSLLTPIVFLTAGHCTDGATTARVYFQQEAGANYDPETELDPVTGYPDSCAPGTRDVCVSSDELYNYGFDDFAGFPNTHDAGLVILDRAIDVREHGVLAAAGSLDELAARLGKQNVTVTISGYGVTRTNPSGMRELSFRERLMATSTLISLTNALTSGYNVQVSANPGGGRGGLCFGDSGGPVFSGAFESNVIVGVNSFVESWTCGGVGFAYRTDTRAVIGWILRTVPKGQADDIRIVASRVTA